MDGWTFEKRFVKVEVSVDVELIVVEQWRSAGVLILGIS